MTTENLPWLPFRIWASSFMQSCLRICLWPGDSTAWCPASLNYSSVSSVFSLNCLELNITRHGELCTSYAECGCSLVCAPPNGSESTRVRTGRSQFFVGVSVGRSCLWDMCNFKTLSRVNLSSVVDLQSHVPSSHSVFWLLWGSRGLLLGREEL